MRSSDSLTIDDDSNKIESQLLHLHHDIEARDLSQADLRLFWLVSALLLDLSDYQDDESRLMAAWQLQQQRRRFHDSVCQLYQRFVEKWVRLHRGVLQRLLRKYKQRRTSEIEVLLNEQLQAVSDWLFSQERNRRVLSVRELMRLVDDARALEHLRSARKVLESYQSYLKAQRQSCRVAKEPVAPVVVVPDWQHNVDHELAVLRYYAEKLQAIESDENLLPHIKAQLVEHLSELRNVTHNEMMQSEPVGDEPCDRHIDDNRLPANVHPIVQAVGNG